MKVGFSTPSRCRDFNNPSNLEDEKNFNKFFEAASVSALIARWISFGRTAKTFGLLLVQV